MHLRKIKKVLIANRGEISVRVINSCKELDVKTVAVFSDADFNSMHVQLADEAYHIGSSPSAQSYLNMQKIIDVAKKSKVDAIHPGYGFLSENAAFAKLCKDENIIFIGPSADAIDKMGDKITARKTMIANEVPVVPGTETPVNDENEALKIIKKVGLPVMIKASAGGGGKGMRKIETEKDIISSIRAARSESKAAFGDDNVYIEKYIKSPHHIEFQILGDHHGNVIHLYERECSVQRRHQKIIEETPSPLLTPQMRANMGEKAIAAAKAVNYVGAGTVEFLADNDQNFYFLEMNTRLQVEHPVTEMTLGIDIVKQQILIAQGDKLNINQDDLLQRGHSIECRIYAEDSDNNFMPNPGTIKHLKEPMGIGIRIDNYVYKNYTIPMEYDPLIAKLIVWAETRSQAINRMIRALQNYEIIGIKTSINFLKKIMRCDDFKEGKYDTHFIPSNESFLMKRTKTATKETQDLAAIVALLSYDDKLETDIENPTEKSDSSKWKKFGRGHNMLRHSFSTT